MTKNQLHDRLPTALMGFIALVLTAFFGLSGTFMWRSDDRLYEIRAEQVKQTTILKQQTYVLKDHERRIRKVETTNLP